MAAGNEIDAFIRSALEALRHGRIRAVLSLHAATPDSLDSAQAMELVGISHARLRHADEARAAFERAIRLDPKRVSAHYNFALFLAGQGALDDAVEENGVALFLQPDHAEAEALQHALAVRVRERTDHGTEGFAVVSADAGGVSSPSPAFARLVCAMCGAPNFVTARTCKRCGSLLPETDPIIPVE